jgi:nitrite reductase (NO-forming)
MANQNQNQNLNQLLNQSFQKKNAMTQGAVTPTTQTPGMPSQKPKKSSSGGMLFKIITIASLLLTIGLGALGYMLYSDLDSKRDNQSNEIIENQDLINTLIDKVDVIENNLSDIETFSQKIDAIEAELEKFATEEDLAPVMEFLQKQDSDNDGLSDYDEIVIYKSDPNKKDTDGDGYEDKDEVDAGYNPAGPGKLGDQELTEDATSVIAGNWTGSLSSEVAKSEDFSLNLTEDNKISGKFTFFGDQNTTYNNKVTGTYTFNAETNKFNAILLNGFNVQDDNPDTEMQLGDINYNMNLTGDFSNEAKQIIGSWNIDGDVPANWPAASTGSYSLEKAQQESTGTLEDNQTENATDTADTDTAAPAQTISVKAFSFGFSPSTIRLTQGQRLTLELTSLDVAHTFTVDELGIDIGVDGGETKSIEYTPDQVGEFEFYCSIPGHREAGMVGTIIVEEAAK